MRAGFLLIVLLMPVAWAAPVKSEAECEEIFNKYFSNLSDEGRVQDFLRVRAQLTFRRMAYQFYRAQSNPRKYQPLEVTIKQLLDEVNNNNSESFKQARTAFNNQKLDAEVFASVLFHIDDLINFQEREVDADRRASFNLDSGDMHVLHIFARLEEQEGFRNSFLEAVENINATLAMAVKEPNPLASIEHSIDTLEDRMREMVNALPFPEDCKKLVSCHPDQVLDTGFFYSVLNKLWVDKASYTDPRKRFWRDMPQLVSKFEPKLDPFSAYDIKRNYEPSKSILLYDITNRLATVVLEKYPEYFPDREFLLARPELTFSLADAIYRRSTTFDFRGRRYVLPSRLESYKAGAETQAELMRRHSLRISPEAVKVRDAFTPAAKKDEFFEYWITQKCCSKHPDILKSGNGTFLFGGELYSIRSGKRVARGPEAFLVSDAGPAEHFVNKFFIASEQPIEMLQQMSERAKAGQNGYLASQGGAFFLTGTKIADDMVLELDPKKQADPIRRLDSLRKLLPNEGLISARGKVERPNPTVLNGELNQFIKANPKAKQEILLNLANNARVVVGENSLLDLSDYRRKFNADEARSLVARTTGMQSVTPTPTWDLRKAQALLNGDNEFWYGSSSQVINPFLVPPTAGGSKSVLARTINSFPTNFERIREYHKNFKDANKCDFYTVVHKSSLPPVMTVYKNDGSVMPHPEDARRAPYKSKLASWEVLLGAVWGDQRTIKEDGLEAGEMKTNKKTAVGVFRSKRYVDEDYAKFRKAQLGPGGRDYYKMYDYKLLQIVDDDARFRSEEVDETGIVMAIHGIPPSLGGVRGPRLYNGIATDNRMTNGCVNMLPSDYDAYQELTSVQVECPIYVLPDKEPASGNATQFIVNNENRLITQFIGEPSRDYYMSAPFLPGALVRERNSPIKVYNLDWPETLNRQPASMYAEGSRTHHPGKIYLETLVTEKEYLRRGLGLSNADYDRLLPLAYAIMGVESDFGRSTKYGLKTIPGLVTTAKFVGGLKDGDAFEAAAEANSKGPTQIKNADVFLEKLKDVMGPPELTAAEEKALLTHRTGYLELPKLLAKHSSLVVSPETEKLLKGNYDEKLRGVAVIMADHTTLNMATETIVELSNPTKHAQALARLLADNPGLKLSSETLTKLKNPSTAMIAMYDVFLMNTPLKMTGQELHGLRVSFGQTNLDALRAKNTKLFPGPSLNEKQEILKRITEEMQKPNANLKSLQDKFMKVSGEIAGLMKASTAQAAMIEKINADLKNPSKNAAAVALLKAEIQKNGTGLPRYAHINSGNLDNSRNAAIATMAVLADNLATLRAIQSRGDAHPGITPANELEYLYYLYNGRYAQITRQRATIDDNPSIRELRNYMDDIVVSPAAPSAPAVKAPVSKPSTENLIN